MGKDKDKDEGEDEDEDTDEDPNQAPDQDSDQDQDRDQDRHLDKDEEEEKEGIKISPHLEGLLDYNVNNVCLALLPLLQARSVHTPLMAYIILISQTG